MYRPRRLLAVLAILLVAGIGSADDSPPSTPLDVAAEYFSAVEAGDLDRAEALFAEDSLIFESGGVEGDWANYRAHHLGAEIDAIESFEIRRGESPQVAVAEDGSLAAVAWPIEYTIELAAGETIESRGTVTFVLVHAAAGHGYRIAQLHWSSRRVRRDADGG